MMSIYSSCCIPGICINNKILLEYRLLKFTEFVQSQPGAHPDMSRPTVPPFVCCCGSGGNLACVLSMDLVLLKDGLIGFLIDILIGFAALLFGLGSRPTTIPNKKTKIRYRPSIFPIYLISVI